LLLAALLLVGGPAAVWPGQPPEAAALGSRWLRPADRMPMVYVPAGEFVMGLDEADLRFAMVLCARHNPSCHLCDPERDACRLDWFKDALPAHRVALDAFWMDQTEVTTAQYARCVRAGACTPPEKSSLYTNQAYYGNPAYSRYPVLHVTWEQASAYCAWVGGRLPTEAEWEYAARGPQATRFPWGDEFDGARVNYCDAGCWFSWRDDAVNDGYADTAPVGNYPAGASWCGALDLAGNLWEWVADWYAEDTYAHVSSQEPLRNPVGPPSGEARVLRGGSWGVEPVYTNSAYRWHAYPDRSKIYWGFRCVRSAR